MRACHLEPEDKKAFVGAVGEDSAARGINANQNDNSAQSSGAVYVFDL